MNRHATPLASPRSPEEPAGRSLPGPLGVESDPLAAIGEMPAQIVFFDGVCSFCDGAVRWLRQRDTAGRFFFASLQGETADQFRRAFPSDFPMSIDSMVYVDRSRGTIRIEQRSDAIIRIGEELGGAWANLRLLRSLPHWFADVCYRLFAANRYRMFGKLEACRIPSPEERERLLP